MKDTLNIRGRARRQPSQQRVSGNLQRAAAAQISIMKAKRSIPEPQMQLVSQPHGPPSVFDSAMRAYIGRNAVLFADRPSLLQDTIEGWRARGTYERDSKFMHCARAVARVAGLFPSLNAYDFCYIAGAASLVSAPRVLRETLTWEGIQPQLDALVPHLTVREQRVLAEIRAQGDSIRNSNTAN